jgi:hypothetical protein
MQIKTKNPIPKGTGGDRGTTLFSCQQQLTWSYHNFWWLAAPVTLRCAAGATAKGSLYDGGGFTRAAQEGTSIVFHPAGVSVYALASLLVFNGLLFSVIAVHLDNALIIDEKCRLSRLEC